MSENKDTEVNADSSAAPSADMVKYTPAVRGTEGPYVSLYSYTDAC